MVACTNAMCMLLRHEHTQARGGVCVWRGGGVQRRESVLEFVFDAPEGGMAAARVPAALLPRHAVHEVLCLGPYIEL